MDAGRQNDLYLMGLPFAVRYSQIRSADFQQHGEIPLRSVYLVYAQPDAIAAGSGPHILHGPLDSLFLFPIQNAAMFYPSLFQAVPQRRFFNHRHFLWQRFPRSGNARRHGSNQNHHCRRDERQSENLSGLPLLLYNTPDLLSQLWRGANLVKHFPIRCFQGSSLL